MPDYEQRFENGYNVPLEKFGYLSRPCMMPKDEVAPYQFHSNQMMACLQPTNYLQTALAWILSDNIWRCNQYRTMEQSLKVSQIQRTSSHITVPSIRAHAEAQVWNIDCEKTNALDKIAKLIKRIESSIKWGVTYFPAALCTPLAEKPLDDVQQNGFVPSDFIPGGVIRSQES